VAWVPVLTSNITRKRPFFPFILEQAKRLNQIQDPRISQSKWRLSLYGVACLFMAFMVVAWGTEYKLSLYKTNQNIAPAKVCTRGSDAARSGVDQVVNAHKLIRASMSLISATLVVSPRQYGGITFPNGLQGLALLRSTPILAARPPPSDLILPTSL
jgi:hypothetical protein